jgi:hypothetical protein
MIDSLEVKVFYPAPDGGERLAKRNGVIARWGLKEAGSKAAARIDKNRITRPTGRTSD